MTVRADVPSTTFDERHTSETAKLYQEGIVAGLIGGALIALWFLVLDTINGRPLYTPSILGTALFRGRAGIDASGTIPIDFDMIVAFTWLHFLVFAALGGAASHLLALAERRPNLGFGIILLFVVFEFGFTALAMSLADQVLHALTWPSILIGNALAAAGMAVYLWRRHPNLRIEP